MEPFFSLIIIGFVALVMEMVDAGMGMGYGTILTPVAIAAGYEPAMIVPVILLSQAVGGFTASLFHHRLGNVNFKPKTANPKRIAKALRKLGVVESFKQGFTHEFKGTLMLTLLGVLATFGGAVIATKLPGTALKVYIGALVLAMGLLLIFKKKPWVFSWKKMLGIGVLASFNKGATGGGFGPLATGGQVVIGNDHKKAIGSTTLAEAPICLTAFLTYIGLQGIPNVPLLIAACVGAMLGAPLGALCTKKLNETKMKKSIAVAMVLLGLWTLLKLVW
ncbi:MAG: sulfite exporter TauE/SafE family protein [Candidatus Woesearchaeota archaeon]|nr:sulfite exporter TauE/SafE family protein [Candidatus Woesearchaeota archaeon]